MEWNQDKFIITDNRVDLNVERIHNFLQNSYWAEDIPKEIVKKSIENSLSFGLFHHLKQVGFGRVVTDYATFAYLTDVFVIEEYRGQGLGKWLVSCIIKHPDVQGLRRWMLVTKGAQGFYKQFEFSQLSDPVKHMEIRQSDIYKFEE